MILSTNAIMSKKTTIIFIIVVILFSFILRVWQLNKPSLWIDEGFTINASLTIIEKGVPVLDSGLPYKNGVFYNYLVAGLMKIKDFDPFSPWQARLPSVFFGVLSVLVVYFLSKHLFNKNVGLVSSVIMAFSYWEIAWSRQARGYVALQFFLLLSFYFLWKWLEKKDFKFLVFFFLSLFFSFLSHHLAVVFIPGFILIALLFPKKRISFRQWIFFFSIFAISLFLFRYMASIPKIDFYNYFPHYNRFIKNELWIFFLGTLGGLFLGIFDKKKYATVSLFLITISSYFFIAGFINVIHYRYLFPLFPFVIILSCYFVVRFFQIIQNILRIKNPLFSFIPSIVLIVFLSFPHLNFIPKENYLLEYGSPQPNFKEAYLFIKENRKTDDMIISPYTHLSKIYLNDEGFWLPTSLSGRKEEIEGRTINGRDYYTNAPIVSNDKELLEIINSKSGYIIIDQMAKNRINKTVILINSHEKVEIIYKSEAPKMGNIWVYKF